jgi:hypothetical protein
MTAPIDLLPVQSSRRLAVLAHVSYVYALEIDSWSEDAARLVDHPFIEECDDLGRQEGVCWPHRFPRPRIHLALRKYAN